MTACAGMFWFSKLSLSGKRVLTIKCDESDWYTGGTSSVKKGP